MIYPPKTVCEKGMSLGQHVFFQLVEMINTMDTSKKESLRFLDDFDFHGISMAFSMGFSMAQPPPSNTGRLRRRLNEALGSAGHASTTWARLETPGDLSAHLSTNLS